MRAMCRRQRIRERPTRRTEEGRWERPRRTFSPACVAGGEVEGASGGCAGGVGGDGGGEADLRGAGAVLVVAGAELDLEGGEMAEGEVKRTRG